MEGAAMSNNQLDVLIWVLIYGGLLTLGLGLATPERAGDAWLWLGAAGGVAVLAGVGLIWVRSRRSPDVLPADEGRPSQFHGPSHGPHHHHHHAEPS
jgi:hypothetical protein